MPHPQVQPRSRNICKAACFCAGVKPAKSTFGSAVAVSQELSAEEGGVWVMAAQTQSGRASKRRDRYDITSIIDELAYEVSRKLFLPVLPLLLLISTARTA